MHHRTSVVPPAHPDPPEEPEVLSKNSHSVTLSWYKPLSDGGCDILGYKVERKIPGIGWQSCSKGIIPHTEFIVDDLTPGEPYRFRVSALNKVGASEPVHFPQMVQLGEKGEVPPRRTASCCRPVSHGMSASPVPGISWKSSLCNTFQCFAANTIQEKELGKKKKNCSGLPQSKTCCVVSTRPLFFQPASSCLAACTASMCCPVTMSFFSGGVQMECIRRGMLECVCGNRDPATEAVMGNVVFFTHLPLSLHYLHIFCNNPHEGVLENSFFAVFWCNFGSVTFGRQSHCLNLSFLATPSVIAECPANSSK